MDYHVVVNGTRQGPYPREEIQARLARGELTPDTRAWHPGLDAWKPLAELGLNVAPSPVPAPAAPARRGVGLLAWFSLGVGLLALMLLVVIFGSAVIAVMQNGEEELSEPFLLVLGFGVFGVIGASLLGGLLGVVGLVVPQGSRVWPAVGIGLNALTILGLLAIILLGVLAP